jgi:hypothetical protein
MNTIKHRAGWIALGVAAAVTLACSTPSTDSGNGSSEDGKAPENAGDYFAGAYPVFDPVEHTGAGDSIIDLPEGVTKAMVTAFSTDDAHFSISALDANNESTGDLLVNSIGAYSGVTALGMHELGGEPVKLEVTGGGDWTITLAPLSTAPELPESGTGDGVFRYEGDAATWAISCGADSHFGVSYYTDADFEMPLLVNEVGAYEGEVAAGAGPGLVTITAGGDWTVTMK